jgi:Tfp pilus assembly protein PilN
MNLNRSWIRLRRVRVGIAIGADRVSFCLLENCTRDTPRTIELTGTHEARCEQIRQGLAAIAAAHDDRRFDLFVAVMPDACQCRFVQLPALSQSDLRSIITGTPDRFFLLDGRDVSIGAIQSRQETQTLIAAASNDVLDPLREACDSNWRIRSIVPAEASWVAASNAAKPNVSHAVAIRTGSTCTVLRIENRALTAVRRIPANADAPTIASAVGAAEESVSLLDGVAEEIAARHAGSTSGPFIRNNAEERRARSDAFRSAALLSLTAVILCLAAATLETRNQRLDAAALADHRNAIAANVDAARKQIAGFRKVQDRIESIDRVSQQSVHPADLLAQLGDFLPDNAYVTQLAVTADSANVEIAAPDAAAALGSLRRSRAFAAAQVNGSIRLLNATADSTILETIRVHLDYSRRRGNRR